MAFVVAGVSGNTGKVVANTLLEAGKSVRVVVRNADKGAPWAKRGASVAVADLTDEAALTKAFAGAQGAYVLVPPKMDAPDFVAYQDAVIAAIAGAVRAAKVPHVVLLSSVGAHQPDGTGPIAALGRAEKALSNIEGTRATFVRAGYFMENLGTSLSMLAEGAVTSFLPGAAPIEMVATTDIGKVAARALVEGPAEDPVIELGGPARTTNEFVKALSGKLGKALELREFPLDAVVPTFTSFGMSASLAGLYEEMFRGIESGRVGFEGGHRRVQGTVSLEAFVPGLLAQGGGGH